MTPSDAAFIAERLLEKTRLELFGGKADLFVSRFDLPLNLETFSGTRLVETREELRTIHDDLCRHFALMGATDHVRRVVAAEFRSDDIIHSTHESRIIQQGVLLQEPYVAFSVLRRKPEGWQVADCSYAISGTEPHGAVLSGGA